MTILNELLPKTDSKIMFVYSKNDPWTGGRPKNLNNPNVQILINPVGVHAECLDKVKSHETYDEATAQAIMKFVQNL